VLDGGTLYSPRTVVCLFNSVTKMVCCFDVAYVEVEILRVYDSADDQSAVAFTTSFL